MGTIKSNRAWYLVVASLGGALLSATGGCATTATSPSAMTPAETAQVAERECAGVPTKERELGILAYRDVIGGAGTLKETSQVGKVQFSHDRGVDITVRAQPGMTAPWLERVASCHIAAAASGRGTPATGAMDPLLVPGASVRVQETSMGYIVSVRVRDDASASEVSHRTQALLSGPSGPAMAQALSER